MLKDTLYHIAHQYQGGVQALATRMKRNPTVLSHKFNPNNSTHFLTTDELEMLGDFADANIEIAKHFAAKGNAVVVLLPAIPDVGDMELLDGYMDVVHQLGELSHEFQKDWADGNIDPKEYARIKNLGDEVTSHLQAFLERIKLMVAEPKTKARA